MSAQFHLVPLSPTTGLPLTTIMLQLCSPSPVSGLPVRSVVISLSFTLTVTHFLFLLLMYRHPVVSIALTLFLYPHTCSKVETQILTSVLSISFPLLLTTDSFSHPSPFCCLEPQHQITHSLPLSVLSVSAEQYFETGLNSASLLVLSCQLIVMEQARAQTDLGPGQSFTSLSSQMWKQHWLSHDTARNF